MEKHLDIHQEGVKATWTNVQGSWYEIHLPYITDTVSAIQLEKKTWPVRGSNPRHSRY